MSKVLWEKNIRTFDLFPASHGNENSGKLLFFKRGSLVGSGIGPMEAPTPPEAEQKKKKSAAAASTHVRQISLNYVVRVVVVIIVVVAVDVIVVVLPIIVSVVVVLVFIKCWWRCHRHCCCCFWFLCSLLSLLLLMLLAWLLFVVALLLSSWSLQQHGLGWTVCTLFLCNQSLKKKVIKEMTFLFLAKILSRALTKFCYLKIFSRSWIPATDGQKTYSMRYSRMVLQVGDWKRSLV